VNRVSQEALDLEAVRDRGETSDLADQLEVLETPDLLEWSDSPEFLAILECRVR